MEPTSPQEIWWSWVVAVSFRWDFILHFSSWFWPVSSFVFLAWLWLIFVFVTPFSSFSSQCHFDVKGHHGYPISISRIVINLRWSFGLSARFPQLPPHPSCFSVFLKMMPQKGEAWGNLSEGASCTDVNMECAGGRVTSHFHAPTWASGEKKQRHGMDSTQSLRRRKRKMGNTPAAYFLRGMRPSGVTCSLSLV